MSSGLNVTFIESLAIELFGDSAGNFVMPMVVFEKSPYLEDVVVVGNAEDAERVARVHVLKSTLYGSQLFLGEGVLSTRDLLSWREQRSILAEAFLPFSSLAKIMPVSVKRADYAVVEKLGGAAREASEVDFLEFYLHEAMAQLHLALLGESTEFSELHNVKLRGAFNTMLAGVLETGVEQLKESRNYIRRFSKEVLDHTRNDTGGPTKAGPYRAMMTGCPVFGPVAAKLAENIPSSPIDPVSVQRDTATTISFAGFDTTANLMTWVTFEMTRRPELRKRLQEEIDQVYDGLNGRELQYHDLPKFTYLTKVINETLRLWTSVPSGTFRETIVPETIQIGNDANNTIALPTGTQMWIPSWLLHRSQVLWGDDVLEFNPDREWLPEECWNGMTFAGLNPSSHRYAPFTFPPRGCIGLNFAQMESRVLLSRMFREYDFEFAEPTKSHAPAAHTREHFLGNNHGTMGPRGGMWAFISKRNVGVAAVAKL